MKVLHVYIFYLFSYLISVLSLLDWYCMYTFYLYLKNQKRISFMIVPELCFQVFEPLFFLFEILNQYKLRTLRPFIPASTLF